MSHPSRPPLTSRPLPPARRAAGFFAVIFCALALSPGARAQTTGALTTLLSFNGTNNGEQAIFPPVLGADGNLYGTTVAGGANQAGTLYRLTPDGTLTVLHSFSNRVDGATPRCSLVLASDGNFYGTTTLGGPGGGGTVFRATPGGTVTVLHAFNPYTDETNGTQPYGAVIQARDGRLYGTTATGGLYRNGTIYRLALDGTFASLYACEPGQTTAGPRTPQSPLVQGSDGNFYGVAPGGDSDNEVFYRMTPAGAVTTLHSFSRADGLLPLGPLVELSSGVFYGAASGGGGSAGQGAGTLFKITRAGQLTNLRVFSDQGVDGSGPFVAPIRGADGNLYGTTLYGGTHASGNVFRCTPAGEVTTLYSFDQNTGGGYYPCGLVQAADGSFYGTTFNGGASNDGVAYRLTVGAHPPFFDGQNDLDNGVEYLAFPGNGNVFGYYAFLADPRYVYHFDLGYEFVFDAADGKSGVYLYDFKSGTFFYTSPTFAFPYLYDFALGTVLYYYPDPNNPGRYNTDGKRYFYNFKTGKIISK